MAPQKEHNDANFRFVAPSSAELWDHKQIWPKRLTIIHGFWPKSENFDFSKKTNQAIEHLKGSRMVQISAL